MLRILILVFLLCCLTTRISGQAKIINGFRAPRGRVPYIVSLQDRTGHACGAVIFTNRTLVTAAHCISDGPPIKQHWVRAGSLNVKRGGVVVRIAGAKMHPLYREERRPYDIGLIYLSTPLTFNSDIQPIELFDGPIRTTQRAVVSGWGTLQENGDSPLYLQILGVRIIPRRLCKRSYPKLGSSQFCAGFYNGGRDACDGDSGGPLEIQGKLAGIVSDGKGCALKGYPCIYADVPRVKDWIISNAR